MDSEVLMLDMIIAITEEEIYLEYAPGRIDK